MSPPRGAGRGVPLAVVLSGTNRHDMEKLGDVLDAIVVPVPMPDEQIEQHVCLDRGYAYAECQQIAQDHGYTPHIPDKDKPEPAPEDPKRHPPRRWRAAPFGGSGGGPKLVQPLLPTADSVGETGGQLPGFCGTGSVPDYLAEAGITFRIGCYSGTRHLRCHRPRWRSP